MMEQLIQDFPQQLKNAIGIGRTARITKHNEDIQKIYIAGMGGSAIGGSLLVEFVKNECNAPILVGRSYDIPKYVDKNTLAIISSYSGNTEESLYALRLIQTRGAKIVCLTSGGKLSEDAKVNGFDSIKLPAGIPAPRACLGYSLTQLLFVLYYLGLINKDCIDQLETSILLLEKEQEDIKNKASKLASMIKGKIPVIYSVNSLEPVALRFRQQLNENAKTLAWHNVIPEMNHNEIVGWRQTNYDLVAIFLRSKADFARNQARIEFTKETIQPYVGALIELYAKGDGLIQKSMYLIHLVDWVSLYLAELKGVDVNEVHVIDMLKKGLSQIGN